MIRVVRAAIRWCCLGVGLVAACAQTQPPSSRSGQESTVVLEWSRTGGFAGFCDTLTVTASGHVAAASCKTPGTKTRTLAADDMSRLRTWRARFANVNVTVKDDATADAMTQTLAFSGKGPDQPSDAQRQELFDWAQRAYAQTGSSGRTAVD